MKISSCVGGIVTHCRGVAMCYLAPTHLQHIRCVPRGRLAQCVIWVTTLAIHIGRYFIKIPMCWMILFIYRGDNTLRGLPNWLKTRPL